MNIVANVLNRMVYHLMGVVAFEPYVGQERIGEDGRSRLHVLADVGLQLLPLAAVNREGTYFAAALDDAHNGSLALRPGSGDLLAALRQVHVARLAPDE